MVTLDHRVSQVVKEQDSLEVEVLQAIQDTLVVRVWDTLVVLVRDLPEVEDLLGTPEVVAAAQVVRLEILTVDNPTVIMVEYRV